MSLFRLIAAAALLVSATAADAADRIALLIGNADYASVTKLKTPVNDASDLGAALKAQGFEVTVANDQDRLEMKASLATFAKAAQGSKIAVFYFAGHGGEVNGNAFMVPTDAKLASAGDLKTETFVLGELFRDLGSGPKQIVVFFDSHRNNPFKSAEGEVPAGLAEVPQQAMLLAHATSPGGIALDSVDAADRNGPFAAALLKHVFAKGVELEQGLRKVRAEVYDRTKQQQMPWYSSSLAEEVYLAGQ